MKFSLLQQLCITCYTRWHLTSSWGTRKQLNFTLAQPDIAHIVTVCPFILSHSSYFQTSPHCTSQRVLVVSRHSLFGIRKCSKQVSIVMNQKDRRSFTVWLCRTPGDAFYRKLAYLECILAFGSVRPDGINTRYAKRHIWDHNTFRSNQDQCKCRTYTYT